MPEKREYQGQTYERAGPGQPWVLVPAPSGPAPVTIGRPDPYRAEDQGFQRDANERASRAEARADEAERRAREADARAAEKQAREAQTLDARGGVETTEGERKAAFLATRVAGGLAQLADIGMGRAPTVFEATAGQTALGNLANAEDWQRTLAVQRDLTDALLTLGTGAAYTAEQIDAYRKAYFPQPGDKPQTIADKKKRLSVALEASRLGAGAAAGLIDDALAKSDLFGGESPYTGARMTPDQERMYDAFMAANPDATADQIKTFFDAAGFELTNADKIIADRDREGGGVAPANTATYQESIAGQGVSGINEGIANTLGLPVDMLTGVMNLVPRGINAVANTDIPLIEDPVLGSDWLKDRMDGWGIYDETDDPSAQFARRVGVSLGGAVAPAGIAGTPAKSIAALLAGGAGGIGGATAQQVAPGNVGAEIAAELIASGGLGYGAARVGQRQAQNAIEEAIPTVDQLKDEAGQLYRQAEARGVTADPMQTQDLADSVRSALRTKGRISPTGRLSEVYPKAKEAVQLIDDYAGQTMNPTQVQTVRSVIAEGQTSGDRAERAIAKMLLDEFDGWASQNVPGLDDAREVSSRYLNAEKLETARSLAEARAAQFTGSGRENAYRTEYRKLDRDAITGKGRYGDDVTDAIMNVSRGTPLGNAARSVGRLAPTGPVSFGLGTVAPATLGTMVAGPVGGAAVGAATTGLGAAGRSIATGQTVRNADIAELIARNGGAIDQAPLIDDDTNRVIAALLAQQQGQYLEPDESQGY